MTQAFKLAIAALLVIAFAFFVLLGNAFAQGLSVSWTLPTQNTDGSAIAAGTLASTTVSWGSCGATAGTFGTEAGKASVAAPATSYTVPNLAPATYCVRALVVTTGGVSSDWSTVASRTITAPVPKPPVLVTVATVAYELNYTGSGVRLGRNVGTVALGVECGQAMFGGYATVPVGQVTLTRAPKSAQLVAECRAG